MSGTNRNAGSLAHALATVTSVSTPYKPAPLSLPFDKHSNKQLYHYAALVACICTLRHKHAMLLNELKFCMPFNYHTVHLNDAHQMLLK